MMTIPGAAANTLLRVAVTVSPGNPNDARALDLLGGQLPEPHGEDAVVEAGADGVEVGVLGEAELAPEPAVGALLAVPVVAPVLLRAPPLAADSQHPAVVLHLDLEVLPAHPGHVHHDLVRVGSLAPVRARHGDHGHVVPVEAQGDVLQDPERVGQEAHPGPGQRRRRRRRGLVAPAPPFAEPREQRAVRQCRRHHGEARERERCCGSPRHRHGPEGFRAVRAHFKVQSNRTR
uniref:Uncharacterized protein n=1 Tax=Zea mays TaxID=4577 RepID=C0PLX9_MAIZE|nr:unknown [Zea mays]